MRDRKRQELPRHLLRKNDCVEHLSSTSLPIGVVHHIEIDSVRRKLEDGDFVIMVTDGILDALPVGEQDILLETIIQECYSQSERNGASYPGTGPGVDRQRACR